MSAHNGGMNPDSSDPDARAYRVRSLRIFGGSQIGLGIVCAILSLVGIIINGIDMNNRDSYNGFASLLFFFNMSCFLFSGWCILTGIFPFCMNEKRRNSWKFLKITFMVFSIIGAAVFMPTMFSLALLGAISRGHYESWLAVTPSFLAVFALIEMVVSIVAASFCCCCSSWGTSDKKNMSAHNGGMNPDSSDPDARAYRVRSLRIFGGSQIGLGIVCAILSLVGIIIHGIDMNKRDGYNEFVSLLFFFNMGCFLFSGWCILTGIFPFCMNQKRRNSWKCLKKTFMIFSIIGAAVFMPTMFSLALLGAIFTGQRSWLAVLASFLAMFALIEMVVSIMAASFCCCCSSWGMSDQRRTVYIATSQPGMMLNIPQTQIANTHNHIPAPYIIYQQLHRSISTTNASNSKPVSYME